MWWYWCRHIIGIFQRHIIFITVLKLESKSTKMNSFKFVALSSNCFLVLYSSFLDSFFEEEQLMNTISISRHLSLSLFYLLIFLFTVMTNFFNGFCYYFNFSLQFSSSFLHKLWFIFIIPLESISVSLEFQCNDKPICCGKIEIN